jgi:D-3-phosphoglycerate dehydrogenase / 2-oxoglutarate reductase
MYTIKLLNKIDPRGLAHFTPDFTVNAAGPEDAILVRSADMHGYEFPASCLAIGRAGTGVNNIPVAACSEKGIAVFNTPGANANAVKELVIAGLLLASRNIVGGIEWVRSLGAPPDIAQQVESGKAAFTGPEIEGKVLGIIGLGAVGALVANAAAALGMKVIGFDPFISIASAWMLSRDVQRAVSLEELLAKADYITIHVPLLESTGKMINKKTIGQMKNCVRLLNFSRDLLVDDDDMEEALTSGKVACYVTDFPNPRTAAMKNVIAIPHLGASTPESETNCAIMAVSQIRDYLEYGTIKNSVNYPDCEAGPISSHKRIVLHHRNIPGMVSQITTVIGGLKINIVNMINKSKGDWAYTIIDVENSINGSVVNLLEAIDHVVRVRVIVG